MDENVTRTRTNVLEIYFENNLDFKINLKTVLTGCRVPPIVKIRKGLWKSFPRALYNCLVRPALEFGALVWSCPITPRKTVNSMALRISS